MDKQKVIDAIKLANHVLEMEKTGTGEFDDHDAINLAGHILIVDAIRESAHPIHHFYKVGDDMAKDFTGGYAEELAGGKKDGKIL